MLTGIVLTKNNQRTLNACLNSLRFCDEIIVFDDFSTDSTRQIARRFTKKIYRHHLKNFAKQRNKALSHATSDWVLFLDSDEVVTKPLAKEILEAIKKPYQGFFLRRQDLFLGHQFRFGETANVRLLRLAKKNAGIWRDPVHEYWNVAGPTKNLKNPLLHNRDLTISQFIDRLNFYTDLASKSAHFNFLDLLKPPLKFLYNYIFLLGFLDGFPGLTMAYLMSLHSLSVRIKAWQS